MLTLVSNAVVYYFIAGFLGFSIFLIGLVSFILFGALETGVVCFGFSAAYEFKF